MKIVLQRVLQASVIVDFPFYSAKIGPGLLVLVGVEKGDSSLEAGWLAEQTLNLRIFTSLGDTRSIAGGQPIYPHCRMYKGAQAIL